jgi:outer membrane protein OmpA-like peptidoglycan-associated protein
MSRAGPGTCVLHQDPRPTKTSAMHATPDHHRRTASHLLAAALATCLAGPGAQAQTAFRPPALPSVEALVRALSGGPVARSFRRTQLPDAGNNLCLGQAAGTPAAAGRTAGPATPAARNLEVVPYAGDSTPGVNLSVQFATGSDRLTPADRALLDQLAAALRAPALAAGRFALAGHTDTTGDAGINLELSCARALAARAYLAGKGVAADRLWAYGFGSTRLLDADEPAGAANRRVEIRKAPE